MPETSQLDFYNLGLAALVAANSKLAVNEGDITDMAILAAAAMADRCDQERSEDQKDSTVDGAEDEELTELADDHYDVDRQPATPATVTLSFERPEGGVEPGGTLSAGFEVATQVNQVGEDVRFVTDADVVFAVSALGPIAVNATAIVAGPDGNVETIGAVSRLIDAAFDTSITVTNTTVAAGGNIEESDPEVRQRIRDRPKTARRATKAALETGALEVDSVRVSSATEDTTVGSVTVNISDADGNSNAEMINDVLLEEENWRAFGIPISVVGGVRVIVDMTVNLTLVSGGAIGNLTTPVIEAITGEINKLVQGQILYDTLSVTAAKNVAPEIIQDVTITALVIDAVSQPLGDYTPASNELIRTGAITVTNI